MNIDNQIAALEGVASMFAKQGQPDLVVRLEAALKTLRKVKATPAFAKAADDEPLFVLRGQDRFAPIVVRVWTNLVKGDGDGLNNEKIDGARFIAYQMECWPNRKVPD